MNAYEVLFDHHNVLRGLCKNITSMPPTSDERHACVDELLVELDIHMRIEDDLFYPAVQAASKLVAIAHADIARSSINWRCSCEHRSTRPNTKTNGMPSSLFSTRTPMKRSAICVLRRSS